MRISAALITKNEERCIARCLNSFKRICDEIMIGDTGSTDRTVEIARSLGATVFDVPWEDSFAKARNAVLDRCRGDWVVILDADEFLRPGDDLRLKAFMRTHLRNKEINALLIEKWEYELNQYTPEELYKLTSEQAASPEYDLFPHFDLRAARLLPNFRYVLPIHETLVYVDPKTKEEVGTAQGTPVPGTECILLHDGYSKTVRREKNLRNLKLLEREIEDGKRSAALFFYAAQSSANLGDKEKKVQYLKEFVTFDDKFSVYGLTGHIMYIEELYKAHATFGEVREVIETTERIYPGHPSSAQLWAEYYNRLGSPQKALDALLDAEKKMTTYPWTGLELDSDSRRKIFYTALYNIGQFFETKGEWERAAQYYAKSVDENPAYHAAMEKYLLTGKSLPASEVLAQVVRWHNPKIREEAQVALRLLRQSRPDTVFLGYFEKAFTGEQDINFIVMMALIGEGRTAVQKLLERYDASDDHIYYLQLATAVAMLYECVDLLRDLPPRTVGLLSGLGGVDGSDWSEDEKGFCLAVAQLMLALGGFRPTTREYYENFAKACGVAVGYRLAVLLTERRLHRDALPYFKNYLTSLREQGQAVSIAAALETGKCSFLVGKYAEALALFREALSLGAAKDAMEDYCLWIAERCPEVADEANALAAEVHIEEDPNRLV